MRDAINFKLWFEYLPSDEPILEMVRQRRRRKTLDDKRLLQTTIIKTLMLPGVQRKIVAKLRRVKR